MTVLMNSTYKVVHVNPVGTQTKQTGQDKQTHPRTKLKISSIKVHLMYKTHVYDLQVISTKKGCRFVELTQDIVRTLIIL